MAEQIDDDVVLVVDGATVLNGTRWDVPTHRRRRPPSWPSAWDPTATAGTTIEIRVRQRRRRGRPLGRQRTTTPPAGPRRYGFGSRDRRHLRSNHRPRRPTSTAADYAPVTDPGDGSRLPRRLLDQHPQHHRPGAGRRHRRRDPVRHRYPLRHDFRDPAPLNDTGSGNLVLTGTAIPTPAGPRHLAAARSPPTAPSALGTLAVRHRRQRRRRSASAPTRRLGSLSGTGTVTLNGNTLTVGSTNNLSSTFGGAIADGTDGRRPRQGGHRLAHARPARTPTPARPPSPPAR